MKLVTSWRESIKFVSNKFSLLGVALPIVWVFLPEDWRDVVMAWQDGKIVLVLAVIAGGSFLARNIKQDKVKRFEEKVDAQNDKVIEGS